MTTYVQGLYASGVEVALMVDGEWVKVGSLTSVEWRESEPKEFFPMEYWNEPATYEMTLEVKPDVSAACTVLNTLAFNYMSEEID